MVLDKVEDRDLGVTLKDTIIDDSGVFSWNNNVVASPLDGENFEESDEASHEFHLEKTVRKLSRTRHSWL